MRELFIYNFIDKKQDQFQKTNYKSLSGTY